MLENPLGERIHLRTSLSLSECEQRIDGLRGDIFADNYSQDPVSIRRGRVFWLYENRVGQSPMLKARLSQNMGWTEIEGRAGSNRRALCVALAALVLMIGLGLLILIQHQNQGGWGMLVGSVPMSLLQYWRYREDPHAGHLIDHLEILLDAKPVPKPISLKGSRPTLR
jgi:hypothetical protein